MTRPTAAASKTKPGAKQTPRTPGKPKARTAPKPASSRKTIPAPRTSAERDRVRKLLPPMSDRYADLWDRGAAQAHAAKATPPLRVALRSAHKKRLAAIEAQTGLDRQTILNRAIESGWRAIQMSGKSLDDVAAKLRRQPSAAGGTVTLHPTAATLALFRKAKHANARSILLQTGLNVWNAA